MPYSNTQPLLVVYPIVSKICSHRNTVFWSVKTSFWPCYTVFSVGKAVSQGVKPVLSVLRAGSSWTPQIVSATTVACNILLKCHKFGVIPTAMNSGRGWRSHFLVAVLGLVLTAKVWPDQPQAFGRVDSSQVFPWFLLFFFLFLLSERAGSRYSKACL